MASENVRRKYDKFGILSSFICIVHCTLLPLAVAFIANIKHPFPSWSHSIDFIFVAVSVAAVYFSSRNSSSTPIKYALWFFVLVFIAGIIAEHFYPIGKTIGLLGSFGLMVSHFLNIRSCRKC